MTVATRRRTGERGAALLVVLWVVVVVGLLAGEIVVSSRFDDATTHNERCRLAGHYAARGAVADARARLRPRVAPGADDDPAGFLAVAGRAGEPPALLSFGGAMGAMRYTVEATDLNARLNVNRADAAALRALFASAGLTADRAAGLADAVADWIDPDDLHRGRGAEARHYRELGRAAGPRNGPVPSLDELLLVRGMGPEILYGPDRSLGTEGGGLDRWLTVEGSGKVNLNTASAEVLAALPGFASDVVAIVIDRRRERPIGSLSEVAADPRLTGGPMRLQDFAMRLLKATTTRSEDALVRATAVADGCPVGAGIDAVVGVAEGGAVEVRAWRESIVPAASVEEAR